MKQLQQRLDKILSKIESEEFLKSEGLGNDLEFYIFDYPAEHELAVREHIDFLTTKLDNRGYNYAHINLFEIIIEMLETRNLLTRAFKKHQDQGDNALFNALKGPLEQNRIAEYIAAKIDLENCQFILLHGLGSAWPIIRGHGLLNSLHARLGNTPLVMFYPGEYDGASLKPFSKIESNNYYRAFKLIP
jgi:hypothetical protein